MLDHNKVLVIKVGSSVLLKQDNAINDRNLRKIVVQIKQLRQHSYKIVLVMSGAVASGSGIVGHQTANDKNRKQLLAGVGQAYLTTHLWQEFQRHRLVIAQLLLTKDRLQVSTSRTHLKNTLLAYLDQGVIPVLNENDVIAPNCFHGNDYLAGRVSSLLGTKKLIILTDVDGLLNVNKNNQLIARVVEVTNQIKRMIVPVTKANGVGGMRAKVSVAELLQGQGVETVILNGNSPNILTRLLVNRESVGTSFIAK